MPDFWKRYSKEWKDLSSNRKLSLVLLTFLLIVFPISLTLIVNPKQIFRPRAYPSTPPATAPICYPPSITPFPSYSCLRVTTSSLKDGFENQPYRTIVLADASGYKQIPKITMTASGLPSGLSLISTSCLGYVSNPNDSSGITAHTECVINGIPATSGSYEVLINVSDNLGVTVTKQISINILPALCGNIEGDANADCKVNLLDYVILRSNFGRFTGGGKSDADFNSSGRVDGLDYAIWHLNFGKGG